MFLVPGINLKSLKFLKWHRIYGMLVTWPLTSCRKQLVTRRTKLWLLRRQQGLEIVFNDQWPKAYIMEHPQPGFWVSECAHVWQWWYTQLHRERSPDDPIPSRPWPTDLAADVYTLEKQQKEKPPSKNPGNRKELLETVSTGLQH